MSLSTEELRAAIQARSDQINAVDLAGGPLVCQILDVSRGNPDQPVSIKVDAHPQPWKPSKTSLRVLCACWGADPSIWVGRWVVLYNEESVKWAGVPVGGIRTSHLSHIDGPKVVMVNETRGKKSAQKVEPFYPEDQQGPQKSTEPEYYPDDKFSENLPKWIALIDEGRKTAEQIIANVERAGKLTAGQRARIRATEVDDDVPSFDEPPPAIDDDPFSE